MYTVKIHKLAEKSLKKLPSPYRQKIKDIVKKLQENPFALDLKKLQQPQKTSHRLRIGAYRIFLDVNASTKEIIIVDIKRRTTQTYR